MSDETLDEFRDVSGWSASRRAQAQLAIAPDDGPRRQGAAPRLRLPRRRRLRRRAQGVPRARCRRAWALSLRRCAARRRPTSSRSSSPIRPTATSGGGTATPSSSRPTGSRCASAAARSRSRGDPRAAARCASSARSRSRSPPGPGGTRQRLDRGPALRGSLARRRRRACARRARARARARRACSTARRERAGAASRRAGAAVDRARLRQEHEYGGLVVDWEPRPRRARLRSADARTTASRGRRAWSRDAGRRRAQLRVRCRAARRSLRSGSICSRAGRAARRLRHPRARRAIRSTSRARSRLLPRRRARASGAACHPRWLRSRADLLDAGRRRGRTRCGAPERGGPARARSRQLLARAVPVRGRRSSSPGRTPRSTQSLAGRCAADSVVARGAQRDLVLTTTAFATSDATGSGACVRYRSRTQATPRARVRLFCALRPFQVTPPWQAFQGLGGACAGRANSRWHDGRRAAWTSASAVIPLDRAERLRRRGVRAGRRRCATSRAATLPPPRSRCATRSVTHRVRCRCDLELAPGAAREVDVAVPFGRSDRRSGRLRRAAPRSARGALRERDIGAGWDASSDGSSIRVGDAARRVRGRAAHRDRAHPRQPRRAGAPARTAPLHALVDPRRRDDVGGAAADGLRRRGARLPRAGTRRTSAPTATCRAPSIATGPTGCPSTTATASSPSRVAEYFRFTGDRALRRRAVARACCARSTTSSRCARSASTPEFASGERQACYGLLPESVSHEGYLAQPVHAYWDDFWALRGLGDAVRPGARARRRRRGAAPHRAARRAARAACTRRSRRRSRSAASPYVPGSVEWADFDRRRPRRRSRRPTRPIACRPPRSPGPTTSTCRGFRKRPRGELDWNNYTAYEIRNLGALVRLGRVRRRARAARLLPRRPPAARVEPVAGDLVARSAQPRSSRRRAAHLDRRRVRARGARACSRTSARRRRARARGRRSRRVARRRRSRDRESADLVGTALLLACRDAATARSRSRSARACERRPAASCCARRSRARCAASRWTARRSTASSRTASGSHVCRSAWCCASSPARAPRAPAASRAACRPRPGSCPP